MDKIIGFVLTTADAVVDLLPEWVKVYDHLKLSVFHIGGPDEEKLDWRLLVWGHGNFQRFRRGTYPDSFQMLIGYDEIDLETLGTNPLQNRGLVLKFEQDRVIVRNDALGMMPVVYGSRDGIPYVSTSEEAVVRGIGPVTLDPGLLVSYLIYQCAIGRLTLWKEVRKQYANHELHVRSDGTFNEYPLPPLEFQDLERTDPISTMRGITEQTIRKYVAPRDDLVLPLSSGQDSCLIMVSTDRPERIHARSYPSSWPADRSWETVIPKARARLHGITDWGILDFRMDYSRWAQPAIEHYGTLISAVQVYLFGASQMMGEEFPYLPIINGAIGDVLAGTGVEFIERWVRHQHGPADPYSFFKMGCYCQDKEWGEGQLDNVLNFDWRLEFERVKADGIKIARETEGSNPISRATLIRLRNRGNITITYPWAAADIWGGIVPVYCDREYVRFMLSLPTSVLRERNGQRQMLSRYYSRIWPHADLQPGCWCEDNTMNLETIKNGQMRSIWPLGGDGLSPASSFFKPEGIRSLIHLALHGDESSWFRLNSLQSLAWAIGEGWVENA